MTTLPASASARALTPVQGVAVLVLLSEQRDAERFAGLLDDAGRQHPGWPAALVPPVRGLDFFAAEELQPDVDRWWAESVPPRALPLWVMEHESGLDEWIESVDGLFVIGGDGVAELYASSPRVTCVPGAHVLDLLGAVTRELGATAPAEPRRPRHRPRFRRAALRPAEEGEPRRRHVRGSDQLFEPTGSDHDPVGVCHELIGVLGDAITRLQGTAG